MFLANLTPKELDPCKISHICPSVFKEKKQKNNPHFQEMVPIIWFVMIMDILFQNFRKKKYLRERYFNSLTKNCVSTEAATEGFL